MARSNETMIQRLSHASVYVLGQDVAYDFYVQFGHRWSLAGRIEDVSPTELRRRAGEQLEEGA